MLDITGLGGVTFLYISYKYWVRTSQGA